MSDERFQPPDEDDEQHLPPGKSDFVFGLQLVGAPHAFFALLGLMSGEPKWVFWSIFFLAFIQVIWVAPVVIWGMFRGRWGVVQGAMLYSGIALLAGGPSCLEAARGMNFH